MIRVPRLVVAGVTSGVGKTTITVGLGAALRARGFSVQPFKCGPDYIDPTYHTLGAGSPCRNLDSWMISADSMIELFQRACETADIAIVEGVMGLYDGRTGEDEAGSTAEIAKLLKAPVILIINVAATARSAGAVALGYKLFDEDVQLAGVVLNGVGSETHFRWARESVEKATGLPVLGYLPKNNEIHLPERHLGLVPSPENAEATRRITSIHEQIERTLDVDGLVEIARSARPIGFTPSSKLFPTKDMAPRVRIGIAQDEAFSFYYQDNLDLLSSWGAVIVPVSPLRDSELPEIDGFYVGGGFPEMYAAQLSANRSFRESVIRAARAGMPIYGECGGLMYLSEGIIDFEGNKQAMVGVVPGWAMMQSKRARMGYITVEALADSVLTSKGQVLRGHEFHWSQRDESANSAAYRVIDGGTRRASDTAYHGERNEGFVEGNILASYVHLHFGGDASLARRFVESCESWRNGG